MPGQQCLVPGSSGCASRRGALGGAPTDALELEAHPGPRHPPGAPRAQLEAVPRAGGGLVRWGCCWATGLNHGVAGLETPPRTYLKPLARVLKCWEDVLIFGFPEF
ncbi:UNVERIFIED_CONTAM: hypothetical protein Sindi_0660100 [Sesamum indicum]